MIITILLSCDSNFAGRGAAFDYSVTDNTVTIGQGRNGFATVTVRVDGIALEQEETFQLRLVANSPPPGIFCLDTLELVIEDGNGINYYYAMYLFLLPMKT